MSTPTSYAQFLDDFRASIVSAKARLSDIPEAQSRQKYVDHLRHHLEQILKTYRSFQWRS